MWLCLPQGTAPAASSHNPYAQYSSNSSFGGSFATNYAGYRPTGQYNPVQHAAAPKPQALGHSAPTQTQTASLGRSKCVSVKKMATADVWTHFGVHQLSFPLQLYSTNYLSCDMYLSNIQFPFLHNGILLF